MNAATGRGICKGDHPLQARVVTGLALVDRLKIHLWTFGTRSVQYILSIWRYREPTFLIQHLQRRFDADFPILTRHGKVAGRYRQRVSFPKHCVQSKHLVRCGVCLVDEKALNTNVALRIQERTSRGLAVAPGAPHFLIVALQRSWNVVMDDAPDIWFINAHAEGHCRYHDLHPIVLEIPLGLGSLFGAEPSVIEAHTVASTGEQIEDPTGFLACTRIYDGGVLLSR